MIAIARPRPVLSTERLVLRAPTMADGPRLATLANDYDVVKHTGAMPFPYRLADARAHVRRAEAADPEREAYFAIERPGDGPIGGLGFYATGELGPEVGYWLGKAHWGQGFAGEALAAAMSWARDEWRQRCVVACHQLDNAVSGQMLIRAGFLYTGKVEPKPCRARGESVYCRWMVWLA